MPVSRNDEQLRHYPDLQGDRAAVLETLARTGTPIFLCDGDNIAARYEALDRCLREHWPAHVIAYSYKTNYLVAKTKLLQDLGAWAEVVSSREYGMARDLGHSGAQIIFNGPHKPQRDLRAAFTDGALVNVNDRDELDRVIRWAAAAERQVEIGIRLSCALERLPLSRFGFSMDHSEATDAVEKVAAATGVHLVSLHMHLYGDTDDASIYGDAADRLGRFAHTVGSRLAMPLRFLNMGGGFPAHSPKPKSRQRWDPQPIDAYIAAITQALRNHFPDDGHPTPTLVVEPGRYLVDDGVVLVTRITHVKSRDGRQVVNCDGSISMVPLTHYRPQVIRAYTESLTERGGPEASTILHGSTCRENDILFDGAFVRVEPGDYLVHYAAGAYNASLSADFIFESPTMAML